MQIMTNPIQHNRLTGQGQTCPLYGNHVFQARLWEIAPQDCFVKPKDIKSQVVLIEGELSPLKSGQYKNLAENEPVSWENQQQKPALLLEFQHGEDIPSIPAPAVTEMRPWGSFTVLRDEANYKLKQLQVNPESRLSLQRHYKREEHWFVLKGHPQVTLNDSQHRLAPGDYIHIPRQAWHRISNPAGQSEPVEIIELQLGEYFGEDDIERQQDDYGRA